MNDLNQAPLNQAALERLSREGHRPGQGMHVLDLARLGQLDDQGQPPDPLSPEARSISDWEADPRLEMEALRLLSHNLTPDLLLTSPLPQLADLVTSTLRGAMTG